MRERLLLCMWAPGVPVGFKRHVGKGRGAFSAPAYARYKQALATLAQMSRPRPHEVWEGAVRVSISVHHLRPAKIDTRARPYLPYAMGGPGKARRADLDNIQKSVADALQGVRGIYRDDRQIVKWDAVAFYSTSGKEPGVEIGVWAIEPATEESG